VSEVRGDFDMLEPTTTGKGSRFGPYLHRTDTEREYAHDRKSRIVTSTREAEAALREHQGRLEDGVPREGEVTLARFTTE
jgi:hypothetical protein